MWLLVVDHSGTRTHDPLLAEQVLYQLSYEPKSTNKGVLLHQRPASIGVPVMDIGLIPTCIVTID